MGHTLSSEQRSQLDKNANLLKNMKMGSTLQTANQKLVSHYSLCVLVTGSHHSGKSATINTILRVLNSEWDTDYGFYVQHSPVGTFRGGQHNTTRYQLFPPKDDNCSVKLFDCPGYDENNSNSFDEFFSKSLEEGLGSMELTNRDGAVKENIFIQNTSSKDICSAVILVMCKEDLTNDSYRKLIPDMTKHMVKHDHFPKVVLTGRASLLKWKKREDIELDVQQLVGTRDIFLVRELC